MRKIEDRKCEYCGENFTPKANNSKYCSVDCRNKQTNINRREKEKIKRENKPIEIHQCEYCGIDFPIKKKNNKYCSRNCYDLSRSDYLKNYQKENYEDLNKKQKIYTENHREEARIRAKKYKEEHPEKVKQYEKKYREEHPEKSKEYYKENKEYFLKRAKKYREEHPEKIKQNWDIWYDKNKDKISEENKIKRQTQEYKNKRNSKRRIRRKIDPLYKLKDLIRGSIGQSMRNNGYKKNSKTHEILGCSYEEFLSHIEKQFKDWMNWDNQGLYSKNRFNIGWDLDHIIPISSAKTEEDVIRLNHYTNFQPLCSKINRDIKRDKLDY